MNFENNASPVPSHDVVVIGAGPAGAEAALAAAATGAQTLCLCINLDTVGYPPANPVLIENREDARSQLLRELDQLGGRLSELLQRPVIGQRRDTGHLTVDRRQLGLGYKELLEHQENLQLRQALVTSIRQTGAELILESKLQEFFSAAAVIIAAGTFLQGKVCDGGQEAPGGRMGEIPANALAKSLQDQGVGLTAITATTGARLDRGSLKAERLQLEADGASLNELYGANRAVIGKRSEQLAELRQELANTEVWMTRPGYSVRHLVLAAGQLENNLQLSHMPGLFWAGRAAGSCNYIEAATLGWLAGREAARSTIGSTAPALITNHKFVSELVRMAVSQQRRPFTIRTRETTC